jgi:hypothetical protein
MLAPLVAAVPAAALLGRGLLKTDFTLLGVFSALSRIRLTAESIHRDSEVLVRFGGNRTVRHRTS